MDDGCSFRFEEFSKGQVHSNLQHIEEKVQCPPEGSICKEDLLWELRQTHRVRRVQGTHRSDKIVVQQCFIPTCRVQDFISGMENSIDGVRCKYVKIRTKPAKGPLNFVASESTPKEVIRYNCQYGPQDHTGNIKSVTSLLLCKQKPKLRPTMAKRTTKNKDLTVEGEEEGEAQAPKTQKKRGRPKKIITKDVAQVVGAKPQKKRGRPKKVVPQDVAQVVVEKTPKRRGRPKKIIPEDVQVPAAHKPKQTRKGKTCTRKGTTLLAIPNTVSGDANTEGANVDTAQLEAVLMKLAVGDRQAVPALPTYIEGPSKGQDSFFEVDDVPQRPQVPPTIANVITNTPCATLPEGSVDLNFPPMHFQSGQCAPSTIATDLRKIEKKGSTSNLTSRERRTVQCKRRHTPRRTQTRLEGTILNFDLNVTLTEDNDCNISTISSTVPDLTSAVTSSAAKIVSGMTAAPTQTAIIGGTAAHLETSGTQENTNVPVFAQDGEEAVAGDVVQEKKKGKRASGDGEPKKKRDSLKQWGGALKRGCLASFSVKTLYLLPNITEISIYEGRHVNAAGVQCHGLQGTGDRGAFSWHLSKDIKEFVLKLLRDGHSIPQIMSKHMHVVRESLMTGKDISRDMFLHERDVRNLATKVARETYMLDTSDAKSVQLWVQANRDSVFFYKETTAVTQGQLTASTMPFTIGIQTPWQREVMLQFGHEGGVSLDATFGTNENKYPLYTAMVFDEWHNGIPVAFILTSRSDQDNLTPWMRELDNALKRVKADWKPNAFIVDCAQGEINSLRDVWPTTAIFLCLWHVHRAWQKQACIKIQDSDMRAHILKGLSSIMYDRAGPGGDAATAWALEKLEHLRLTYPAANEFWDYVKEQWIPRVHMWVVGYRNLPYAGQDTNAAVESYHGYMKSVLKAERSRMTGRRVDWCIHVLTGDILTHYWYHSVRKQFGFVDNRKERGIVVSALILARDIPDNDVTLPIHEGAPAYVTSSTHRHLRYAVHNPGELWATCSCMQALRGNMCKHKVKVLRILHPRLAEGTVARHCGALKGTKAATLGQIFTPERPQCQASVQTASSAARASPSGTVTQEEVSHDEVDLHCTLMGQTEELLHFVRGNKTLMAHLHADLCRLQGKMKKLATDLESGVIHPESVDPVFCRVEDGMGMRLARMKDWLERSGRPPALRRLRLGGESPA